MKKLKIWSILLLMAMALPMVVACSSDSGDGDDSSVDVAKAVGSWFCIKSSDKVDGYTMDDLFVGQSVTINANGSYTSSSSSFGTSGSYQVSGNKIIVVTNSGRRFVISVSFSGNKMTWKGSGEGVTFTYVFEKEDTSFVTPPY